MTLDLAIISWHNTNSTGKKKRKTYTNKTTPNLKTSVQHALTSVAQWVGHQPTKSGSIPGQGTCLSYGFGPSWGT